MQSNFTILFPDYASGNYPRLDKILPVVYNELKTISSKYLRDEYKLHTFQTTELVHEAFIKLVGDDVDIESRAHFYGIAAKSMRQILVDHARKKKSQKRGSGKTILNLDNAEISINNDHEKLLALDIALNKLEGIEKRTSKIVELRFFSGLSIDETAKFLNISQATVKRDWQFAKAWLMREIT